MEKEDNLLVLRYHITASSSDQFLGANLLRDSPNNAALSCGASGCHPSRDRKRSQSQSPPGTNLNNMGIVRTKKCWSSFRDGSIKFSGAECVGSSIQYHHDTEMGSTSNRSSHLGLRSLPHRYREDTAYGALLHRRRSGLVEAHWELRITRSQFQDLGY